MQNCKMVYPMYTWAFLIGVPERPGEIARLELRSRKRKISGTCVYSTAIASDKLPVCRAQIGGTRCVSTEMHRCAERE